MTDASQYLTSTVSACRVCGQLLPAQIWLQDNSVYFHKHCPTHGEQKVHVYSDARQYVDHRRYHRAGSVPLEFATLARGCPDSCGLCPNHEQHVCMPILEITDHCDLACPICLVKTPGTFNLDRARVAAILDRLIASEGSIDVLNLSGGEPTLNSYFRDIVDECTSRKEILYTSVSTNGRRLARDPSLLQFLADRRVIISLQFDGVDDAANCSMRGANFAAEKLRLVDLAAKADARMSLTFTAARGLNDQQFATPIRLLFQHDHILSVMIQPMAYVGQGASVSRPDNALTIPDILKLLDAQCPELAGSADFSPLPCSHPVCFSLAFYLRVGDHEFLPIRKLVDTDRYLDIIQNRALPGTDPENFQQIQNAMYDLWSGPAGLAPDSRKAMSAIRRIVDAMNFQGGYCASRMASVTERSIKSIFIHQFMDRDTFDLSRCRKCCQVYPLADGRLMPACVYNCLRR